jgi:thiol-disulfide isomerase/thioredoxin
MSASLATNALGDSPDSVGASVLPRYQLHVGQELVYAKTLDEDLQPNTENDQADESVYETKLKWWVWVTRQNANGSWHLIIRKRIISTVARPGKEPQPRFENDILGYCDLSPDGKFEANPSIGGHAYFKPAPEELFVQLPADERELAEGWTYPLTTSDEVQTFTVNGREGDVLHFDGPVVTPTDKNYELSDIRRIDFDVRRGFVVQRNDESKANWKINPWHRRKTYALIALTERDTAATFALAADADSYFASQRKIDELQSKAYQTRTKAETQVFVDQMRNELNELSPKLETDEIKQLTAANLMRFDDEATSLLKHASKREEIYGKPALEWETTDLDGKPQRLADYRGKIVLLDFWYRGCGHCIDALPKVKKLYETYDGKGAVVLGVNNDDDPANARYVIDKFALKHNNIKAGDLPEQYSVNAWPTFIVIDQEGRVADYHEGNSADLYEHVARVVENLLAHPPGN